MRLPPLSAPDGDVDRPAVGVDLGGTKLAVGALISSATSSSSPEQLLAEYRSEPVDARDYEATLATIAGHVRDVARAMGWSAPVTGVALAGFLSPDRSEVVEALNLGWQNKPLRDDLARLTGGPVIVHNDANAAAWGEFLLAGSPQSGSFVTFTLGTDVGGGVIAEGRLLTGAFGIAGELGHLVVEPGGPICVCGASGCLAVYASGKAMTARVRELLADESDAVDVSAQDLMRMADQDDPRVLAVIDRAAQAIATASAQISRVVDHHTLVIGGGASQLGEPLLAAVRRHLTLGVLIGPLLPTPHVQLARAGNRAGVIGAAALARDEAIASARHG